jgi:hypothetical protein
MQWSGRGDAMESGPNLVRSVEGLERRVEELDAMFALTRKVAGARGVEAGVAWLGNQLETGVAAMLWQADLVAAGVLETDSRLLLAGRADDGTIETGLVLAASMLDVAGGILEQADAMEPWDPKELGPAGFAGRSGAKLRGRTLAARLGPLLAGVGPKHLPRPLAPNASPPEVKASVEAMLKNGSKTIGGVLAAAAAQNISSAEAIRFLGAIVGQQAAQNLDGALNFLRARWQRLKAVATRVVNWVVKFLSKLLGKDVLDKITSASKKALTDFWGGLAGGTLMGALFKTDALTRDVESHLAKLTPQQQALARTNCAALATDHEVFLKRIAWGISAVGGFVALASNFQPQVKIVFIGSAVLLAIAVAWYTHDRLDAPGIGWMPSVLDGIATVARRV